MSALIANALYRMHKFAEDFADTKRGYVLMLPLKRRFSQTVPMILPETARDYRRNYSFQVHRLNTLRIRHSFSQHPPIPQGGTSAATATDRADFITGVRLPGGRHGAFDYAGTKQHRRFGFASARWARTKRDTPIPRKDRPHHRQYHRQPFLCR